MHEPKVQWHTHIMTVTATPHGFLPLSCGWSQPCEQLHVIIVFDLLVSQQLISKYRWWVVLWRSVFTHALLFLPTPNGEWIPLVGLGISDEGAHSFLTKVLHTIHPPSPRPILLALQYTLWYFRCNCVLMCNATDHCLFVRFVRLLVYSSNTMSGAADCNFFMIFDFSLSVMDLLDRYCCNVDTGCIPFRPSLYL
jgi:hypothetical protein